MKRLDYGGFTIVRTGDAPETPPPCPTCNGAQWIVERRAAVPRDQEYHDDNLIPCPACFAAEYQQRQFNLLVGDSGLKDDQAVRFATITPYPHQEEAYTAARDFALVADGKPWLWLHGDYGTGKTLLAKAVGNEFLARYQTVLFRETEEVLDWLREGFHPKAESTPMARFEAMKQAALVVLDDFDPTESSPWARRKLFQLLNHRWQKNLPLVVTTNLKIEELDERMKSRVRDTLICRTVHLENPRGGH